MCFSVHKSSHFLLPITDDLSLLTHDSTYVNLLGATEQLYIYYHNFKKCCFIKQNKETSKQKKMELCKNWGKVTESVHRELTVSLSSRLGCT